MLLSQFLLLAFVALSTQGDNFSPIDFAGCFFSVKELAIHPVNDSEPPSQPLGPEASPSPVSSKAPAEHLIAHSPLKKHRHKHWFKLITSIGIMVIGSAILLLVILILLIRKKSRELTSEGAPIEISSVASPYRKIRKNQRALEKAPLAWHTRIQIAIDVANALEYLHFYCDPPLCHSDIKSSNILLDGNFLAKVADFGLAHASRSAATSFEPVETIIQVTPGYVDPEFVVTQELTEKSDVYSYGVLLLELFTGKRVIHNNITLLEWSQEFMDSDSKLSELIDPRISNSFNIEQFQVIVRIIQWCTEREGTMRPTTTQVIRLLYERLDPLHSAFLQAMEDEGDCGVQRESNRDEQIIAFSGDPRYLSSSGTSRSYCSRSVLLESSPHSPNGVFST
ncbi:uncharacterized protein A4U43_C09F8550 [Asparagus officinalis]|uniref:Protein kinase domain-containing protein n=1 Tax=Asparagus officinalis TaxID=4686 RepID=A0A5P1E7Z2_ASPOF|nr:uncharacterized protein A4U43_C09F8550 [Asparagus officinalis]